MQDLLSFILENIIEGPVSITSEDSDGFIIFNVKVPKDQVGIVIGKSGRTINAIKNVLKIRAIKENARVDIQVNEA